MVTHINANSLRSVFIEMFFNETFLSSGSAFFASANNRSLLLTNRHNVTGKNNDTGECLSTTGGIPNKLRALIPITSENHDGITEGNSWQSYTLDLYFDEYFEEPVWIEHPLREKVDVVGLLVNMDNHSIDKLDFDVSEDWYEWEIGSLINVLGFPFGLSADRFPIWMTGYIASEPNIDFDGLPMVLIDCRTRKGQSGSPVVATFKKGHIVEYEGKQYQSKVDMVHILGIYSGRINAESDLGRVWKKKVLREILLYGIQAGNPLTPTM